MGKAETAGVTARAVRDRDRVLVTAICNRSRTAYEDLYDRFARGLHRFAMARLQGDVEGAEDVVVETMASAVRDIKRFNPGKSSFAAWVYGIARRRVTLSRPGRAVVGPPECQEMGDWHMDFKAVDDSGYAYRQSGHWRGQCGYEREYIVTEVERGTWTQDEGEASPDFERAGPDAPDAGTVTITVWPYSEEYSAEECVTFENLPLPEPQSGVDLYGQSRQYMQY